MPQNLISLCIIFCFCFSLSVAVAVAVAVAVVVSVAMAVAVCCCCVALFPYGILYLPRKLIVISWLCRYSYNCCILKHFSTAIVIIVFDYYEDFRYLDFWLFVLAMGFLTSFLLFLVFFFSRLVFCFLLLFFSFITT